MFNRVKGPMSRSLRSRNFRVYLLGQAPSFLGLWMQETAELWVILRITDSGAALGLHSVLRFGPLLVFGLYGGLLSDRMDRRRLITLTQAGQALATGCLAVAAWGGDPPLLLIYGAVLAQGVINAIDNPLRRAFVRDLVDDDSLANAVGLHSTVATVARTVGPAFAGLLIAAGAESWCFAFNSLSYVLVVVSLQFLDSSRMRPPSLVTRSRGQVRAALRYAWNCRPIRTTLPLSIMVSIFAFNWSTIVPVYATEDLGGDANLYGSLVSLLSVGAVLGALLTARQSHVSGRFLSGGVLLTAGALGVVTVAPSLPVVATGLIALGMATTVVAVAAQARLLVNVDGEMSGRILSLYSVGFVGLRPVGGVIAGLLIDLHGARLAFAVGAVIITATVTASTVEEWRHARAAPPM